MSVNPRFADNIQTADPVLKTLHPGCTSWDRDNTELFINQAAESEARPFLATAATGAPVSKRVTLPTAVQTPHQNTAHVAEKQHPNSRFNFATYLTLFRSGGYKPVTNYVQFVAPRLQWDNKPELKKTELHQTFDKGVLCGLLGG